MDQLVEIKSKIHINPSREGKKYFIKTFGCQMNEHDSERISGMFELDGMSKAISEDNADVLFVNTCTCLLYTSPSPRDQRGSRMPSSA